jgi:hypothetical protein
VRRARFALAVAAAATSAPVVHGGTEWLQYGNGVEHANYANSNLDPTSLKFAWQAPAGFTEPLVANGAIYSMTRGQGNSGTYTFASFNPTNGRANWTATGGHTFPSAMAYADGMLVYFAQEADIAQGMRLWVRDAGTGAVKYSLSYPLPDGSSGSSTPLLANDADGNLVAYFAGSGRMHAARLGAASGTKLWDVAAPNGVSISIGLPSIVGGSVVIAEVGKYSAYDRTTGARNTFHTSNISGGGNSTPIVDAARNRVYITAGYDSGHGNSVTAYQYDGSNSFSQVWQYNGVGAHPTGGGGLDADGNLYVTDNGGNLVVLNSDGGVVRSLTVQGLATGMAPLVTNDALYLSTNSQTRAYGLAGLDLLSSLDDARGNNQTITLKNIGAITDDYLVVDHFRGSNSPGFSVYRGVPEPATTLAAVACAAGLLRRHRRRVG